MKEVEIRKTLKQFGFKKLKLKDFSDVWLFMTDSFLERNNYIPRVSLAITEKELKNLNFPIEEYIKLKIEKLRREQV